MSSLRCGPRRRVIATVEPAGVTASCRRKLIAIGVRKRSNALHELGSRVSPNQIWSQLDPLALVATTRRAAFAARILTHMPQTAQSIVAGLHDCRAM